MWFQFVSYQYQRVPLILIPHIAKSVYDNLIPGLFIIYRLWLHWWMLLILVHLSENTGLELKHQWNQTGHKIKNLWMSSMQVILGPYSTRAEGPLDGGIPSCGDPSKGNPSNLHTQLDFTALKHAWRSLLLLYIKRDWLVGPANPSSGMTMTIQYHLWRHITN